MICGLDLLAREHASMVTRTKMAEDQWSEVQDLLVMFFVEHHAGAETFLREIAAAHAQDYVERKAQGVAA